MREERKRETERVKEEAAQFSWQSWAHYLSRNWFCSRKKRAEYRLIVAWWTTRRRPDKLARFPRELSWARIALLTLMSAQVVAVVPMTMMPRHVNFFLSWGSQSLDRWLCNFDSKWINICSFCFCLLPLFLSLPARRTDRQAEVLIMKWNKNISSSEITSSNEKSNNNNKLNDENDFSFLISSPSSSSFVLLN